MYAGMVREFKFVGNWSNAFFNLIWSIVSTSKFLVGPWKYRLLSVRVESEINQITNLEFNVLVLVINSLFIMVVGSS